MNKFSKEFSKKELALIIVFILLVLGALYYFFVFVPVSDGIKSASNQIDQLEGDLEASNLKIQQIDNMQEEMASVEDNGHVLSRMPSYNAGDEELNFLHSILTTDALGYTISFSEVTRTGNQIRRHFTLDFTAKDFDDAEMIIDKLENSEIRCLIDNMTLGTSQEADSLFDGEVGVNCVATFYETMYGGVEDSELPPDALIQVEDEEEVEE